MNPTSIFLSFRIATLSACLALGALAHAAASPGAGTNQQPPASAWKPVPPLKQSRSHKPSSHYAAGAMPEGARRYYAMTYGVDQLSAKLTESGALVRFSYRVVDAGKAKPLQDQAAVPTLTDEAAHVALVVPTMEKVGPLRQTMATEAGKSYWMAFSNKGAKVKVGQRVSVLIGPVRLDGLIVEK